MGKRIRKWLLGTILTAFLLGIHDGNLALWVQEDPEPVWIFDQKADSLPPADQILLRKGLAVGSVRELFAVLENYL